MGSAAAMLLEPRDHLDQALIGYGKRPGDPSEVAIYDHEKLVEAMWATSPNSTREEIEEYISFNTEGAWVGPGTPIILRRCSAAELEELLS